MPEPLRTVYYDRHLSLGAKMVEFGGWDMPLQYKLGIVQEHLSTRKNAGLFDVSHMGRFTIRGDKVLAFVQKVLTNDATKLDVGLAQYTMIPNDKGGAIDDAYLYRFVEDEYMLVVNASNREKDWSHLESLRKDFPQTEMVDRTRDLAMISLQGPRSEDILSDLVGSGHLPAPKRNSLSAADVGGSRMWISRTGYTGEPICFELFIDKAAALETWDSLIDGGAQPVGLGARDTLRLEADLPLYGHELGLDPEGNEIQIFASHLARFAVSFSPSKGDYVGKGPLSRQSRAMQGIKNKDYELISDLPRRILAVELVDKGIARAGDKVYRDSKRVGYVTSGTMVPYWEISGEGDVTQLTDQTGRRAIGLALVASDLSAGDAVDIEIRARKARAMVVPYHLKGRKPPHAIAVVLRQEQG